jgi:DNA-binding transcriptional ArsR family regulator
MASQNINQSRFQSIIFHALSDPIRLEIVTYLRDGEKCVCEIVPHLDLIQPLISGHLKILKNAGIVNCRKDGTKRMYSIVDKKIYDIIDALSPNLMEALRKEILENATYR